MEETEQQKRIRRDLAERGLIAPLTVQEIRTQYGDLVLFGAQDPHGDLIDWSKAST